ncbi:MAG: SMP-30/gluconolactonase/LRE family protein [Vicinamibacteria bacterium]
MRLALPLAVLASAVAASAAFAQTPASPGRVERLDPRIDALIPKDAKVELLADGIKWAEGPVWDKANGRLIFSDVPNNVAYQWSEKGGKTVFLKPSGYTGPEGGGGREPGSNGLAFDAKGRLTLTQCGDRRISRLVDGKFVPVVERFEGKRFNSPNDLVWAKDGSLYFTDPPYGLTKMFDDPGREIPWCGVYRVGPDGKVTVLVKDLRAPNGIGLSPDEKTLYVSQSDPDRPVVMAYELKADGTLGAGRVFFDAKPLMKNGPGLPDGLKVDAAGNVWTSGPGGILILSPKGEHLGSILTGVPTANLNFAPDGTVYMTANDTIRRIRTNAKGLAY